MRRIVRLGALSLFAAAFLLSQTWTQLAPPSTPPALRGAKMEFHAGSGRAVLFGGEAIPNAGLAQAVNDTWLWDGTAWTKAAPANSPSSRRYHAMAYDAERGEIVLFGGMGALNNNELGDTWIWNGVNWIQRSPAAAPPARSRHAMAYDPVRKVVVLFGGGANGDDTWAWNGTNWSRLTPPTSPPGRQGHGMAWDAVRQVIVLYGGTTGTDTWTWDGSAWTNRTSTANPGFLADAVMLSHAGRVLINGGWNTTGATDATWMWDGVSWKQLMTGPAPPARMEAAGTWDPVRDRTLIFGGWAGGQALFSDSWSLAFGAGCLFTDAPPSTPLTALSTNGSVQFAIPAAAGCPWSASSDQPWLTLTQSSGTGPGTLSGFVTANPGPNERYATVRVSGRDYLVLQAKPPCPSGALPPSPFVLRNDCSATFTYTAAAGEQIAIRAIGRGQTYGPRDFMFSSYVDIKVTGPSPGTGTIASAVSLNGWMPVTYLPATGVLTFPAAGVYNISFMMTGGQNASSTIDWIKSGNGCTPTVRSFNVYSGSQSVGPVTVPAHGDPAPYVTKLSVGIPPGCPALPVSATASWVKPGVTSVQPGFTTITPEYEVNIGPERSASLNIGPSVSVSIRQEASTCTFSLSSVGASVNALRTTGTVVLTATGAGPCAWSAWSSAPWLQANPIGSVGSASVAYTAFPNFGTAARTASLTIAGQTFTVTQAAASGTSLERFVRLLYFSFLGRMPTAQEVAFQAGSGQSRDSLALNFYNSAEFNNGGRFVAGLYVGLLNRDAEFGGWLYQRDALANGIVDHASIVTNFIESPEFTQRFGFMSDRGFVTLLYRQVLLREPSTAEVDFHAAAIGAGLTRAEAARNFLRSAEFAIGSGPRLTAFLVYATLLQRAPTDPEFTAAATIAAQAQAQPDVAARQAIIRDQLLAPIVNGTELNQSLQ